MRRPYALFIPRIARDGRTRHLEHVDHQLPMGSKLNTLYTKKDLSMNRYQKIALESYRDGVYRSLTTLQEVWATNDILLINLVNVLDEVDVTPESQRDTLLGLALTIENVAFSIENACR